MAGKSGELHCGNCKKLLLIAEMTDAKLEIKCPKCKQLNVFEVKPLPKPPVPFQERMNLVKKVDDSLSFTIKHIQE